MRHGKEAVLARGSPRGGAEVYTFWINQDIIVPVSEFVVSAHGCLCVFVRLA